jgi:hypothetical protein
MALKNKVMAYLLGKYVDFLTQRVTFYKSRTSLYADFEIEHLKDIDDAETANQTTHRQKRAASMQPCVRASDKMSF